MSIRNLDHVFKAKSVALIGASQTRASVGNVVARNLAGAGFEGPVLAVNPKYQERVSLTMRTLRGFVARTKSAQEVAQDKAGHGGAGNEPVYLIKRMGNDRHQYHR